MKIIINLLFCCISYTLIGQSSFEQLILDYEPIQKETVSKKDFDFGKMIIRETKSAVKADENGFNIGDYWNVCTAFIALDESEVLQSLAFEKCLETDGVCDYLHWFNEDSGIYKKFTPRYQLALKNCPSEGESAVPFDLKSYCKKYQVDQKMVKTIIEIRDRDAHYRKSDYNNNVKAQRKLDEVNQKIINNLYKEKGAYLGQSLVGPKFESVMWAVIQHSNIEMMEQYLPVIAKAVEKGEIHVTPLKMLIDRIYGITEGFQIFGSQLGIEIGPESTCESIRKRYGIN